jgi:hypothetical protein
MTVEFEATWPGIELGDYRACGGTYEDYPYSSLPILDNSQFTGHFDWLPDHGGVDPAQSACIAELDRQLGAARLALPVDFVRYHTHANLSWTLVRVSGTGCGCTLLAPYPDESQDLEDLPLRFRNHLIPSPAEPGAYLIRFLADQQDCLTWYLYLRPPDETFVVHSYGLEWEVDDDGTPAYLRPGVFPKYLQPAEQVGFAKIFWCAPSFEQFVYRFWIENAIVDALFSDPKKALTADQAAYLDHYRRAGGAP